MASFSSKIKKELSARYGGDRHCDIAEAAAIINACGMVSSDGIKIQTENLYVAKKFFTLIRKTFNIEMQVSMRRNSQLKKNMVYTVFIKASKSSDEILFAAGIKQTDTLAVKKRISPLLIKSYCCKRAYLRAAFLCSGSLADPEKNYHLEFVNNDRTLAQELIGIINFFGLFAKMVERKDHFVVYLKEGEQIVDLLNIMEAHVALMDFENVRILKDMRNNVNRAVNCETANLNKTVSAAVRQIEDIIYIKNTKGLEFLSPALEEVANMRLEHSDISLKEIGQILSPPVGKSGVNHRLRKISDIADNLRGDVQT